MIPPKNTTDSSVWTYLLVVRNARNVGAFFTSKRRILAVMFNKINEVTSNCIGTIVDGPPADWTKGQPVPATLAHYVAR